MSGADAPPAATTTGKEGRDRIGATPGFPLTVGFAAMTTTYAPHDAGLTMAGLAFLKGDDGSALRASVAALADPAHPSVAEVAALRRIFPADALHAALVLSAIQKKAQRKFPEIPYFYGPPEALEQASSSRVAGHKAKRFRAVIKAGQPILDLCAGVGGDAMPLADVAPVTAVELTPIRAECLRLNLAQRQPKPRFGIDVAVQDIAHLLPAIPADSLVHIDPARRAEGKRSPRYLDLIPGPPLLERILTRAAGAALKLSPAVDFDSLPPGHLELISEMGAVVQAILWTGSLAFAPQNQRTATLLDAAGNSTSFTAPPAPVAITPLPHALGDCSGTSLHLLELDGSITRAALAAAFTAKNQLLPLTADGGYALYPGPSLKIPFVDSFRIHALITYSERRVAAELARCRPLLAPATSDGPIEVKCRGHLPHIDTDALQKAWSQTMGKTLTVLIFRHGTQVLAAIATRTNA